MAIFGETRPGGPAQQKAARAQAAHDLHSRGAHSSSQTSWLGPLLGIAGAVTGGLLAPAALGWAAGSALGGMAGSQVGSGTEAMIQGVSRGSPQAGGRGPGFAAGLGQALGGGLKALGGFGAAAAQPIQGTVGQWQGLTPAGVSPLLAGKVAAPTPVGTFDMAHGYNLDALRSAGGMVSPEAGVIPGEADILLKSYSMPSQYQFQPPLGQAPTPAGKE